MARRANKAEAETRFGQILKASKAFDAFRPASEVLTVVRAVPTRFCQVDHASRVEGWPIERFTLGHGPSNHGKTAFAIGLLDSFLQLDHLAHYIDAERTTPFTWVEALMGARAKHPGFTAQRPDTYEGVIADVRNYLNTLIRLKEAGDLAPDMSAIIVVDSLRKLVPRDMMKLILAEAEADPDDIKAGKDRSGQLQAKMNAAWMDEIVPMLEKAGAGIFAIAREMQDTNASEWDKKHGLDFKIGGGGAIFYDSSLVVRVERAAFVQHGEGKDRKVYGERHRVTIRKTKVAGKDDKVAVGHFHTSNGVLVPEGFDRARDVLELARQFGVVKKADKGHQYRFDGKLLASGEHNVVVALTEAPELLGAIEAATRAQFKTVAPMDHDPVTGEVLE